MTEKKVFYQPFGHTGFRGKGCPVGEMVDPANVSMREECPTSELNYRVRHLGVGQLTKTELEKIGFTVDQGEGRGPQASCKKCGNKLRLRRVFE